nr:MAG TPA: hypothetical protein [Caudoviricetes sp.]DAM91005.1 MAG TPA: hypothetical protein [Caudoviricetes sp.]DAU33114.1 MAG TPA: hypothetical protein [Caudoviricetes sp.]DAX26303.1 MAG TPA: hypothetical protein [Caudoviricetes sp.]
MPGMDNGFYCMKKQPPSKSRSAVCYSHKRNKPRLGYYIPAVVLTVR